MFNVDVDGGGGWPEPSTQSAGGGGGAGPSTQYSFEGEADDNTDEGDDDDNTDTVEMDYDVNNVDNNDTEYSQLTLAAGWLGHSTSVVDCETCAEGPAPFSGHALFLCPNTLHLEHLILAPNFLNLFGFLGSLLSSGPLIRSFIGLPRATLGLGGSNMSCLTARTIVPH